MAAIDQQIAVLTAQLEGADEMTQASLGNQITALEGQKAELQSGIEQLAQAIQAIQQGLSEISDSKDSLQSQLNQIATGLGKSTPKEALDYISEQTTSIWNSLD